MKLILVTFITATLATSAFAGNSDRYNDQRFNSAVGHQTDKAKTSQSVRTAATVVFASRNAKSKSDGRYLDANPLGVGPYNDSR